LTKKSIILVAEIITINNFLAPHRNLASPSPPQKNISGLGYFFDTLKVKKKTINLNFCYNGKLFDKKKSIILVVEIVTIDNFLALRGILRAPLSSTKKITEEKEEIEVFN
jgi:hypothetical protein